MKHVLGIGGVFFKAQDPEKLAAWYREHLGLDVEEYGGVTFREDPNPNETLPARQAYTVWSPFPADTDYSSDGFVGRCERLGGEGFEPPTYWV